MSKKSGFTLIELLVTIAILGILATVAVAVFNGVTARTRDSQRIKDLQSIKQALELYRGDQHNYPKSSGTSSLVLSGSETLTNCTGIAGCTSTTSAYLQPVPRDIDTSKNYYYLALPSSPACDNNSSATTCTSFILCAKKESTSTTYDLSDCSSLSSCGSAGNCDIGISSQ